MKQLYRLATISAVGLAAAAFVFIGLASTEKGNVTSAHELDYPVLLIHGLGEGPGEDAFGNLGEFLEDFYFNVEMMDFNKFSKPRLTKNVKVNDNLGILAAILGMRIREVVDQYGTDKLQIIAHSYGGIIVQAYLLNMGEEYAKKGFYDNNVRKVCYIQTPFYGADLNAKGLKDLAKQTDYGPYTNVVAMLRTLEMGSKAIFDMDDALRHNNFYRPKMDNSHIDAVTFLSRDDEIVPQQHAVLNAFMKKGNTHTFHRFSVFGGRFGKYSHSTNPLSAVDNLSSLAYVEKIDDLNFLAIASFLDNGRFWHTIGFKNLPDEGMIMVKYEKKPGYKTIAADAVAVKLKKSMHSQSPPANKKGEVVKGTYNSKSRVFVFRNLTPGRYLMMIKNSRCGLNEDVYLDITGNNSYSYDPKKNELYVGGSGPRR